MNYVSFKVLDNGPKYNFVPWWTLLTILLSHQDNWKIDKCSYISTKNCITLLSDVFAGGGIMRNSLFFQIPRLITKLCLPFFYLFQYLSTKLTLQLYCKLILDSEKEQFKGKNWIKKEPTGEQLQNTPQLIYMSLDKNSVYCVMPRSSKPPDTCKWGGPKLRGILKFSPCG